MSNEELVTIQIPRGVYERTISMAKEMKEQGACNGFNNQYVFQIEHLEERSQPNGKNDRYLFRAPDDCDYLEAECYQDEIDEWKEDNPNYPSWKDDEDIL